MQQRSRSRWHAFAYAAIERQRAAFIVGRRGTLPWTSRALARRDSTDTKDSIGSWEYYRRTEFGIRIPESRRNMTEHDVIRSSKANFHFPQRSAMASIQFTRKSQQGNSPLKSHRELTSECVSVLMALRSLMTGLKSVFSDKMSGVEDGLDSFCDRI